MASADGPVSQGRILVVDDDRLCATAIARTLSFEHHVACASSAAAALKLIAAGERFDLILCDLMMPDATGMDFHAELQRLDPSQSDLIIFLTGGASSDRARDFLEQVPNLVVEKPVSGPRLRALVNDRIR